MAQPESSSTVIAEPLAPAGARPWYAEVGGYPWLVLIVASIGWIFDIYENQIYIVTRGAALPDLLKVGKDAQHPLVKYYGDVINIGFLVGGAIGGVLFGAIADRFGRVRAMSLSIVVYAVFSALTAFSTQVWHVAVLRFFVAVGTGGEWAVAAALVSEVFPARARAHASGIFHASSVLGILAAGSVGMLTGDNWRLAYLVGLGPALLVLVIRFTLREPARTQAVVAGGGAAVQRRDFRELWDNRTYRRRAILGLMLGAVGLAGYWCVYAAGQDLAQSFLLRQGVDRAAAREKATFAYTFVQMAGGAVGLFAMGPLCAWLGRRRAFVLMHVGAIVVTPITCFLPSTYNQLLVLLPVMAFFVNGMHAGYAVYFPELFPTRYRATGAGLCFNGGRLVAAPMLYLSAWLKGQMDLRQAITILGTVYVIGLVVILFMPETKGRPLED
jgi:MFS family permease